MERKNFCKSTSRTAQHSLVYVIYRTLKSNQLRDGIAKQEKNGYRASKCSSEKTALVCVHRLIIPFDGKRNFLKKVAAKICNSPDKLFSQLFGNFFTLPETKHCSAFSPME